jgi:hypothetical protein
MTKDKADSLLIIYIQSDSIQRSTKAGITVTATAAASK